jgi:hypothetical protein
MNWMQRTQDSVQWRAYVKSVMNLQAPKNMEFIDQLSGNYQLFEKNLVP